MAPSKKSINGEIALITGAGHGMGRLFSLRFAALGAKVVVGFVNCLDIHHLRYPSYFRVKMGFAKNFVPAI